MIDTLVDEDVGLCSAAKRGHIVRSDQRVGLRDWKIYHVAFGVQATTHPGQSELQQISEGSSPGTVIN